MAELVSRVLSGRDIVLLPPSADLQKAKLLYVFVQVVRFPRNEYLSVKWNPAKSFYAHMTFLKDGVVQRAESLEFPHQSYTFDIDSQHQQTYALICAYDGILDTFVNLGLALNLAPILRNNEIKQWKHTYTGFDEIWFQCYADSLLQVSIKSVSFDRCSDEEDNPPNPPPEPPPPPPAPIPPGTPADQTGYPISPPYDGREDEQEPHPIDVPEEAPPPTRVCDRRKVRVRVYYSNNNDEAVNVFCYGDVGGLRVGEGGLNIALQCYGLYTGSGAQDICEDEPDYFVFQGTGGSYTIIDGVIESNDPA